MFANFFQKLLNASLIGLGIILCYFLLNELFYILKEAFNPGDVEHDVLERVLVFFLYFGFISMIVKYFKEHYHFPLRYLIYIGITATVRFIIVNRQNVYENLILSIVILVLMLSYLMLTPKLFLNRVRDEG
ncbi:phosphate-starvation-inducible protein PsiE [Fodinisporobacter ferrooxydans]|uniref:Protein PsiE n=2 Tax=Fodinisporobacter ferrooxydans TaxID=2901836 RepID=A0ABY4CQZ9_9BACL|nr:phosphate-starvation-inducible protein PsiE [Alicyclobacillaceae bacterium MYW30-H2]